MQGWIGDLRYALRSIATARGFAAIVIATLALGIGANTAVFGVLNAVVLQPPPYDEPDRLVRVYLGFEGDQYWPAPAVVELRDRSRTLDAAAVYTYAPEGADLTDREKPERVRTLRVSADYFRVLRVSPRVGRFFTRADERASAHVAVVSDRIWRHYLDNSGDAEGRMLSLNGIPHRVAAVLPPGFTDPLESGVEIWIPVALQPGGGGYHWGNHFLTVIARVRSGNTLEQAQAEAAALAAGMPWASRRDVRRSARVTPLHTDIIGSAGYMLWILLGAVGLLLIIACVNVASLFLARGMAREAELAVRAALGCTRWRMARQLLIESLVLSLAGGAAGVALAGFVRQMLVAVAPEQIARAGSGSLEVAVLAFSIVMAVAAGVGFGVVPALQLTRPNLEAVLRESGRAGSGSRRQARTRNVLVVCQIALALVLLCSAGLLIRSFQQLRSLSLGVRAAHVLTFQVHLPSGRYGEPAQRDRFHREFQARLASLPWIRAVGAVSRLPATGTYHRWGALPHDAPPGTRSIQAEQRVIQGAYFDALAIPLLRGRSFSAEDDASAPRRVVVSREMAGQAFGDRDPIGLSLKINGEPVEVIGVVGDVAISARGDARPTVYHSHQQFADNRNWALTQVVKMDGALASFLDGARRELALLDPALVLHQPRTLDEVIGAGIAQERFAMRLVAAFALLAVVLAAIGIYGLLSYTATRRTREMGIRMALGATVHSVSLLIIGDGCRLAIAGVMLGLFGAYAATRTLRSLLFEVSVTDPAVFVAAAIVLAVIAVGASWLPARAATRVNPLDAVRTE